MSGFSTIVSNDATETITMFPNAISTTNTNFNSTTANATRTDPLSPCPREVWEIVIGLLISILIVVTNIACIKVKVGTESFHHPENRFYIINLAISNTVCGIVLLITNVFDIYAKVLGSSLSLERSYLICTYWAPIYIYCVMTPYVALATMGWDVALYCHHSIDYRRRMTRWKMYSILASGWIYTLLVVASTVVINPEILCDKYHWEINILFVIFPVLLMFLPAVFVIFLFAFIIRNYWIKSQKLSRRISMSTISGGSGGEKKSRLVGKFFQKFSHLIIFSIGCSVAYTSLALAEAYIETKDHRRICVLYRLDRVFISLNSLLSPWIHCLATEPVRRKLLRKYAPWCSTDAGSQSFSNKSSAPASRRDTNRSMGQRPTKEKIQMLRTKGARAISPLATDQRREANVACHGKRPIVVSTLNYRDSLCQSKYVLQRGTL